MALEINAVMRMIHEGGRQVGAAVGGLGSPLETIPPLPGSGTTGQAHLHRMRAQAIAKRSAQAGALGGLASQAPMARTMMSVGKAFAAGGPIAGVATGVTAIVGIAKQLLGMSKIFGTMSKTFFQMTSMMIDMALMPLIPHMMRFLQWWLREGTKKATEVGDWLARNGPNIAKAMAGLAKLLSIVGGSVGGGDRKNPINLLPPHMSIPMKIGMALGRDRVGMAKGGVVTQPTNALIGEAGPEAVIPLSGAGSSGGGLGGIFQTIMGGMGDAANSFSSIQKRVTAITDKISISTRRNLERWYYDMLGGSIVPDTISSVGRVYTGMQTAAEENLDKSKGEEPGLLSKIGDLFKGVWNGMKLAWNKAKEWAGKVFGWLNPLKKDPDSEEETYLDPEVDGISDEDSKSWWPGWGVTMAAVWGKTKEWAAKVWGWLWPFGEDEEPPTVPGISENDGTSWYGDWGKALAEIYGKAKDWVKSGLCDAILPLLPNIKGVDNKAILKKFGLDCDTSASSGSWSDNVTTSGAWGYGVIDESIIDPNDYGPQLPPETIFSYDDIYGGLGLGGGDNNAAPYGSHPDDHGPWLPDTHPDHRSTMKKIVESPAVDTTLGIAEYLPIIGGPISGAKAIKSGWDWLVGEDDHTTTTTRKGDSRRGMDEGWGDTGWSVMDNPVTNVLKDAGKGILGGGGWLADKASSWGWPGRQMGGMIPGPVGAPVPTIMHGGEVVLPAHLGTNWAAATAGNMISSGGHSLAGAGGGGVFAPTVNRPMQVIVYTTENTSELLSRLNRMASLEDAAFFGSV